MAGITPFGCGRCRPCRINRRRQWMWRQYLESLCHEENCFVTLTYRDEDLPEGASVRPDHMSSFVKRLRERVKPTRFRFFGVGEYGDESERPHYHLSLFGLSGVTDRIGREVRFYGAAGFISECWPYGNVMVAEFNELTAQYVAGYVVKKMTAKEDDRLNGRHPEFARMSLRPGLGAMAMPKIIQQLRDTGQEWILETDVPRSLKLGKRSIPLGRYLLRKLREEAGFSEEKIRKIKDEISYEQSKEMLPLLGAAIDVSPLATAKSVYLEENTQRVRNLLSRSQIFKKKGQL